SLPSISLSPHHLLLLRTSVHPHHPTHLYEGDFIAHLSISLAVGIENTHCYCPHRSPQAAKSLSLSLTLSLSLRLSHRDIHTRTHSQSIHTTSSFLSLTPSWAHRQVNVSLIPSLSVSPRGSEREKGRG